MVNIQIDKVQPGYAAQQRTEAEANYFLPCYCKYQCVRPEW